MTTTILDTATRAAAAAATTQEANLAAAAAPWAGGDVTVRCMAGAVIAETCTYGPLTFDTSTPRGMALGALSASTVNVSGATVTSYVLVAAGTPILSVPAADITMASATTLTGRRINLADAYLPKMRITANAALPLAATYLATFSADDGAIVGVPAAGNVANNGTGPIDWSITPPSGVTVTPASGTLAAGASQTLVITGTVIGAYTLTLVSVGTTITGPTQYLTIAPVDATAIVLSVPSNGTAGTAVTVTLTPNGPIPIGGAVCTLSTSVGTLGETTKTFSAGSSAAQTTTLTLASAGTATVTMTNDAGLTNTGSGATFTAAAVPGSFASVVQVGTNGAEPLADPDQIVKIELHGSGTVYNFYGRQMEATLTGGLEYDTDTVFKFAIARDAAGAGGVAVTVIRPHDRQGTFPVSGQRRESYWMGWTEAPGPELNLFTERRLVALFAWIRANVPNISPTKWCLTGGSMGGWGTFTFGIRHPELLPAIWGNMPRTRGGETGSILRIPSWTIETTPSHLRTTSLALAAVDGGGSVAAHHDHVSYVANTANDVPWIGWHIGTADPYMPFSDHVAFVAALRSAGRGFAFYWNSDGHTLNAYRELELMGSYPYGLFELGKGYPVFSEHSLDNDPATDPVGGINIGLTFRNVVETTGTWSCEVSYPGTLTRAPQACTVKVKPKSSIYTGNPAPQLVNVPAAGAWVTVSF